MSLALDQTGVLPANLISAEVHDAVTAYTSDLNLIWLSAGLFYSGNIVVNYTPIGGTTVPLVFGVDYDFIFKLPNIYPSPDNDIYAAIILENVKLNGSISITYQALGGNWALNKGQIVSYYFNHYLNTKNNFAALIPDPTVYAANSLINLSSYSNIAASFGLFPSITLALAYLSNEVQTDLSPGAGVAIQPISASTLPLPSGAATAAKQPAINADGGANSHITNTSLPLPTNAAIESGGNLAAIATTNTAMSTATGTIADTAYAGSGNGTLVSLLKGIFGKFVSGIAVNSLPSLPTGTNSIGSINNLGTLIGPRTGVETLSQPGVARQLSAGITSTNQALTATCTRISIVAVGSDIRYNISNAATTASATTHLILQGERLDLGVPLNANIAVMRTNSTAGILEITEYLS